MVDFNNEITVTMSAENIMKTIILERRYNLIEALEKYNLVESQGFDNTREFAILKSRLYSYFIELEPLIKRQAKYSVYNDLRRWINSDKIFDIKTAILSINKILDEVKLTKIDNILVKNSSMMDINK